MGSSYYEILFSNWYWSFKRRHIIGFIDGNEIKTVEIYRFSNGVSEHDGHLTWNVEYSFQEVKNGKLWTALMK